MSVADFPRSVGAHEPMIARITGDDTHRAIPSDSLSALRDDAWGFVPQEDYSTFFAPLD